GGILEGGLTTRGCHWRRRLRVSPLEKRGYVKAGRGHRKAVVEYRKLLSRPKERLGAVCEYFEHVEEGRVGIEVGLETGLPVGLHDVASDPQGDMHGNSGGRLRASVWLALVRNSLHRRLPSFLLAMESRLCTRWDMHRFALGAAYDLGVRYMAAAAGFEAYHIRAIAEELAAEKRPIPAGLRESTSPGAAA
uniref:Carn_acyltransf domain-containing protein n=1 Tax=Macrostomum lignano TaxID=282301 RepID=A0A1I8FIK6_9PLAT